MKIGDLKEYTIEQSSKPKLKLADLPDYSVEQQAQPVGLQPLPGDLELAAQEAGLPALPETQLPQIPIETETEKASRRPEASLGPTRRALFALDPLQANREAFLTQEFGAGNVIKDDAGDLFIKDQKGQLVPVNAPGITAGDIAELVAATPEIALGTAGAFGGGGVPGAAIGAGLGSLARQQISRMIGEVPQVAGRGEQLMEAGTQALLGGGGEAVVGKALPYIGKKIAGAPIVKEAAEAVKRGYKTVFPEQKRILSEEAMRLSEIAKKEGLPEPTPGQILGEPFKQQEKILAEIPHAGKETQKMLAEQNRRANANVEKIVGKFAGKDSIKEEVGGVAKKEIDETLKTIKKSSQSFYDDFAEKTKNVQINSNEMADNFLKEVSDYGFFDATGSPLPYSSFSGLEPDQYNAVMAVLRPVVSDLKGAGNITPVRLNSQIKTLKSAIKRGQEAQYKDVVLSDVLGKYNDAYSNTLRSYQKFYPEMKENLKILDNANETWREYKRASGIMDDIGVTDAANEKIYSAIFKDSKSLDEFESVVGKDMTKKLGDQYLWDLFKSKSNLGGVNQKSALKLIEDKAPVLKRFLTPEEFSSLKDNLEYLIRVGEHVNPPKSGIIALLRDKDMLLQALRIKKSLRPGQITEPASGKAIIPGKGRKYIQAEIQSERKTKGTSQLFEKEKPGTDRLFK